MKKLLFYFAALVLLTITAACKKTPEYIPVESVIYWPNTFTVGLGFSQQLQAFVSPENATDQTVTWSSSDPSVVTVSDTGFMTTLAVGEATVTATAGGVSYTSPVNVHPVTTNPTSLVLDQTELTLE